MKVLHVGKFYPPVVGGIERAVSVLCHELKKTVDVEVLVAADRPWTRVEQIDGVRVIRAGSVGMVFATPLCPTLPLWITRSRPEIIHVHLPNPAAGVAALIAGGSCRLIVSYHSDVVRQRWPAVLYQPLLMRLLARADKILVTSPRLLEFSPVLSSFRQKCVVIPWGIDVAELDGAGDETTSFSTQAIRQRYGERVVLFVGRLSYYKGLDYLIRAMKQVEATLLVVGTGEMERPWRRLIEQEGLGRKVVMLGGVARHDLIAHYHACTVFVLPSIFKTEAFGIVQLEAMAAGRPVVSTALESGVPWVNQDGKTGLIVPPRDAQALGAAINRLLADRMLRETYGTNGRQRVLDEFTKERMAARVLQVYAEVMGGLS